jgi:hypothetical protein
MQHRCPPGWYRANTCLIAASNGFEWIYEPPPLGDVFGTVLALQHCHQNGSH